MRNRHRTSSGYEEYVDYDLLDWYNFLTFETQ